MHCVRISLGCLIRNSSEPVDLSHMPVKGDSAHSAQFGDLGDGVLAVVVEV